MRENTRAKTVAAAVAAIVFLLASAGAYELWATDTARRNFESGEVQWDTGDYRTEPTAFRPIDTTDQSLKTFLYGNHVVLPYELDSRLYISPGYNPAYTTSALRGWAQGVPGTTCWSRDQENGTTYNCALVYGRYVAVAHSDDLINDDNDGSARYDLSQKIAAQYLLLQQMSENKK